MTKLNDAIDEVKEGCGEIESFGRTPCSKENGLCDDCEIKLSTLEFAQKIIEEDYVAKEKIESWIKNLNCYTMAHILEEDIDELLKGGEDDKTNN